MPSFLLKTVSEDLPVFVRLCDIYIVSGNQPFGYCRHYKIIKFDTHHHVFVVKASSSHSIFDLEHLNKFHPTIYFIRQLLPSMPTLTIVPKFHICNTLFT